MNYTEQTKADFGRRMSDALISAGFSRPGRGPLKGQVVPDYRWFAQAYTKETGESITYKAVEKWCKGDSFPETSKLNVISLLLNTTNSVLLGETSPSPLALEDQVKFKRAGLDDQEEPRLSLLNEPPEDLLPDDLRNAVNSAATCRFVIEDESMSPTFKPGDEVLLTKNAPPSNQGSIAVIQGEDGFFVRRIIKSPTGGVTLVSDNQDKNLYPNFALSSSEFKGLQVSGYIVALTFRAMF